MTLAGAGTAGVRIIVWCKSCSHQTEPDPSAMAARYGAETRVLEWKERRVKRAKIHPSTFPPRSPHPHPCGRISPDES